VNTTDLPGAVRYHLYGYHQHNEQISLGWEIPIRLWPLMGSLVGADWGDGAGDHEITHAAAEQLAAAMGSNLSAHPNCHWQIGASVAGPRPWKHIWLDAAKQLEGIQFALSVDDAGRVRELLYGYAGVVRELLGADVNGGLDEEYIDYPNPFIRPR
jgi:hypothetical protein